MKLIKHALIMASLSISVLGGCSSHTMAMKYQPSKAVQKSVLPVKLAVGQVVDNRAVGSNWLGSIDGGLTRVSQRVYSNVNTADAVATIFTSGLQSRDMWARQRSADYRVDIDVAKFTSTEKPRKSTHANLIVTVSEIQSGKLIFNRHYRTHYEAGNGATSQSASAIELGKFANFALSESVDRILDDPELHAALQVRQTLALVQ